MVYVTPGIRWAMLIWCAVAVAVLVATALRGAPPLALGLIAVVGAGPLVVGAALTRFRPEALTAAQVLHDKGPKG